MSRVDTANARHRERDRASPRPTEAARASFGATTPAAAGAPAEPDAGAVAPARACCAKGKVWIHSSARAQKAALCPVIEVLRSGGSAADIRDGAAFRRRGSDTVRMALRRKE